MEARLLMEGAHLLAYMDESSPSQVFGRSEWGACVRSLYVISLGTAFRRVEFC